MPDELPPLVGATMTAEIAVLNKTAVALAADSAVTISAGRKEEKIFNSADKLFELSDRNPIGVMIYNATSFAEIPLQSLIRDYRSSSPSFSRIEDAAAHFLDYLHEVGRSAPSDVRDRALLECINPIVEEIAARFQEKFQDAVTRWDGKQAFPSVISEIMDTIISSFERIYSRRPAGRFIGATPRITRKTSDLIREYVSKNLEVPVNDQQRARIVDVIKKSLKVRSPSPNTGGIVIAGYGTGELFPTLVSFELDGLICNTVKYRRTHKVDIDRSKTRAKVLPFAQKEMVERFLYGLDVDIQKHLRLFCTRGISSLRKTMLKGLEFENDEAREEWIEMVGAAETEFLDGLANDGFGAIRSLSESEIETMVEFMPKPELAKMAEALVNLTSIKRQVSRGMETVGGPVDVAVVSASEGFVWVKRKHYFPPELNARYGERVRSQISNWRTSDEAASRPGS